MRSEPPRASPLGGDVTHVTYSVTHIVKFEGAKGRELLQIQYTNIQLREKLELHNERVIANAI